MIACVSPGFSSANHTINTLRYSDRLKEKTSKQKLQNVQENNFLNKVSNEIFDIRTKTDDLLDEIVVILPTH